MDGDEATRHLIHATDSVFSNIFVMTELECKSEERSNGSKSAYISYYY